MKSRKLLPPATSLGAQLVAARAEHRERESQGEIAALRRQLRHTVAALERARRVKLAPLRPARSRPTKGDITRLCVGDLHGAKRNPAAVAAFLGDVKLLQPDHIILGGDIADCGGFLAQHHTLGYVAETAYSYEEDIACANQFLDALAAAAPRARIEFLEGNHERRVETWCITETLRHPRDAEMLRKALAPEFLLRLKDRGIAYYRLSECYDGLTVPGVIKRGKCFYFHGITTSKHAAAMTLLRTSGNSVYFHTPRAQTDLQRRVSVGVIGAWNPGCLCELQPLWQHGAPTDWTNGYGLERVARDGSFLHINIPIIEGRSHLGSLFSSL